MDDIKSIEDVFNSDESLSNLRDFIQQADVIVKFHELFPDLKKIAKATRFDKKILYLWVENPAWRSELQFKQRIIIERINSYFGSNLVKSVKFSGKRS
ncbi:MAG: DUF721 domain-containing protein [Clostridiales bacterium]